MKLLGSRQPLLFHRLPELDHVSCDGEVSLVVDNDDPSLTEGNASVTFHAPLVGRFNRIILCESNISIFIFSSKSNIDTHPAIVMLREHNGVEMFPCSAVPHNNPVLISNSEEVSVKLHKQIVWLLLQLQGRVIHLQPVEQIPLAVVTVDFTTIGKLSEDDDITIAVGAHEGYISG